MGQCNGILTHECTFKDANRKLSPFFLSYQLERRQATGDGFLSRMASSGEHRPSSVVARSIVAGGGRVIFLLEFAFWSHAPIVAGGGRVIFLFVFVL